MRQLALIDSGSKTAIVSQRCMERHRLHENALQGRPSTLFGADGNPIQVKGETDLDFEVEGYHMNARFKIAKKLVYDNWNRCLIRTWRHD